MAATVNKLGMTRHNWKQNDAVNILNILARDKSPS